MITDEDIKRGVERQIRLQSLRRLKEKADDFNTFVVPMISIRIRKVPIEISNKKLRYYRDLIFHWYPLYKFMEDEEVAKAIKDVFKCKCTTEDLQSLKSFKQITKKEIITTKEERVETVRILRWRGRDNLHRNIIHFPI